MSSLGYYNNGKRLKEGCCYTFKFIKKVKLEDEKHYLILEDHFGIRHFIELELYKNYGIENKSEISCLVDKINCTGRIFLEPEHPYYKTGDISSFDVLDIIETENGVLISVHDCFNNLVTVLLTDSKSKNLDQIERINAKIEGIRKGVPELQFVSVVEKPDKDDSLQINC